MKRIALLMCTTLVLLLGNSRASASWGQLTYSGYQPWYNIFAKRYKCLTPEEERLQKFWHDYYHALKNYYCDLDAIDWVAYYKNHGYAINNCGPGGCGRINYAPVFVSPTMQWAAPSTPMGGQPQACGPMMGGFPPPGMGMGFPPPGMGMGYPPPGYGPPPPGYGMPGPGMPGPGMPGPGMPGPGQAGPGGPVPVGYGGY
jgi:hypothetical protein